MSVCMCLWFSKLLWLAVCVCVYIRLCASLCSLYMYIYMYIMRTASSYKELFNRFMKTQWTSSRLGLSLSKSSLLFSST